MGTKLTSCVGINVIGKFYGNICIHCFQEIPATTRKLRCCDVTDTVDILLGESAISSVNPVTIPQLYERVFIKIPNGKALCWKDSKEGPWQSITYAEYKNLIYNVAKSFIKVIY